MLQAANLLRCRYQTRQQQRKRTPKNRESAPDDIELPVKTVLDKAVASALEEFVNRLSCARIGFALTDILVKGYNASGGHLREELFQADFVALIEVYIEA